MKAFIFLLILIIISAVQPVKAQYTSQDSITIETAQADGMKFRLRAKYMKRFAQQKIDAKSDFFKPSNITTTESALLQDSLYNQAFRKAAYKSAVKQIRNPTLNNIIYIGVLTYIILLPTLMRNAN